jgi:hypothetical protein
MHGRQFEAGKLFLNDELLPNGWKLMRKNWCLGVTMNVNDELLPKGWKLKRKSFVWF